MSKKLSMLLQRRAHARQGGAYLLHLRVTRPMRLLVGALGEVDFPAGSYLYVGSALGGIAARTERHRRVAREKRSRGRWHIDCLLIRPEVKLVLVEPFPGRTECALCRRLACAAKVEVPVPGFGATDCSSGCAAHLYRLMPGNNGHQFPDAILH